MSDAPRMRPRVTLGRTVAICSILLGALMVLSVLSLMFGASHIGGGTVAKAIWETITLSPSSLDSVQHQILFDIRLRRILLAMIVGAALAMAGAGYQALLRNPLADPYVLGVSSGAALAAVLSMTFAPQIPVATPLAAFAGAILTIAFVYFIGHSGKESSTYTLLLTGIVTASFLYSLTMFLISFLSSAGLRGALFWLLGDLSIVTDLKTLGWLALAVLGVAATLYWVAGDLNLMLMGEPEAESMGVHVRRTKIVVYLAASLATGIAVSVGGSIGYLGLVVPHGIRMLFGSDYRLLLPAAALGGAATLVAADTVARTVVAPRELQVGAVMAVLGAPVFLYLLRRPRAAQAAMVPSGSASESGGE